jgi:recombination protein RecA
LAGKLVEISANAEAAHLTAAFGLVLEAQLGGDCAAWVTLEHSSFFPPDVMDGGIDLDALPVARVPDVRTAGRVADHLVRSGGFGLVVIDLSSEHKAGSGNAWPTYRLPVPLLVRLFGLARQQNVTVLLLTKKSHESPSLHSLISLRAEAQWHRREGRYELSIRVLKDKRGRPGWIYVETCHGPAGLR